MTVEGDWAFLEAALPELQPYILSNDLYRPLRLTAPTPGSVQTPQLSIGSLLLSQVRLSALVLPAGQAGRLVEISHSIDQVRQEWRSNWGKKAGREFTSRLNLWQQYLRELRGDKGRQNAYFANEVRQRAILTLLQPEILEALPAHEVDQLTLLDTLLRGLSQAGPFVWEPELADGFSPEKYWYLYIRFHR